MHRQVVSMKYFSRYGALSYRRAMKTIMQNQARGNKGRHSRSYSPGGFNLRFSCCCPNSEPPKTSRYADLGYMLSLECVG